MEHPTYDPEAAKKASAMAQTPEGKALVQKLMESRSEQLNAAIAQGDLGQVKKLIEGFLKTPEAQALRQQMEGSDG